MSRPANTMVPASGASRPEIWLISVVLPAPFGPMMACSSPGMHVERQIVGDDEAAEVLAQAFEPQHRFSHGRASAQARRQMPDQAAAREQDDQHEHRSEDHLPMLGEAGQPFLREQIGGRADDRAVERAEAAEDDHDDQLARALPRHVGGAHELGGVGEQEARQAAEHAGDHIGRELKAVDVEADGRHADADSPSRRAARGRSARRRWRGRADRCRADSRRRRSRSACSFLSSAKPATVLRAAMVRPSSPP